MERTQGLRRAAASLTGAVVLSLALAGGALASPSASGAGASLAEIRQATAMYLDVGSAIADGYVPVSPCVEAPDVGAMGFHYLKPGLAADLAVDARTPEILVYAPSADGLRLVAVEYFVAALANTESGPAPWFGSEAPPLGFFNTAPSVLGQTFNGPMAGHDPGKPWHYDLHAWIWQANPAGTFAQFNPKVSC
jgi:hypothetical protein